ncbi:MAG TPA: prolyl oligopeptidase family serine peptidase [Vicinamibacterales bacterium]|nr:prolyl oligopeptidase family serine peptidase [Vicinamibacterales bacterium]
MRESIRSASVALVLLSLAAAAPRAGAPAASRHQPTFEQFTSPPYPVELVAAKKADRIAWIANDKGRRNVYTAAGPRFHPVRITSFMDDDGIDTTQIAISDDGAVVTFTRGHTPNREGWIADPDALPQGVERAIWAVHTADGSAWRLAEGSSGALSPDGRWVAFAKEGQIYRVPVAPGPRANDIDKGLKPFVRIWGTNGSPVWSPDSRKIAFVSSRTDHSFIAVYDLASKKITYMAPSVDWDTSPTWSPDSRRVAFVRRPGTPFAQQAQPGSGGLGNPPGPAYNPLNPNPGRGEFGGRGGRGQEPEAARGEGAGQRGEGGRRDGPPPRPGLTTAAFAGGYTVGLWVADAASGEGREFWHNAKDDKVFTNIPSIQWAVDSVVFQIEPEEWTRVYAVKVDGSEMSAPVSLTPQEGQIETSSLSPDRRYFYYGTNATDIERRHIWRVPTSGGAPELVTTGEAIEHEPVITGGGRTLAVLSADWNRPQSVGVYELGCASGDGTAPDGAAPNGGKRDGLPRDGVARNFSCAEPSAPAGAEHTIFPVLTKDFPADAHVKPELVITKAADGLEIHNQLFLPKDIKPGEKRPAIIFVHGGPIRQMLLGYHYMEVYHTFYAVNQWLASQGYVVMSVNYRGGIGYGKSFRMAPGTNARGNSEYQDVVAGAKYLQSRPDVDPKRVGIWGLSYGGLLTSEALARNSDIFVAGVDLAGVHLYGNNLDPDNLAYKSSAISAIDTWKSPVLLIQGDDDRNVNFAQSVGLVELLRAHDVPFELMVLPDDVHETLLYKRWIAIFDRMEDFLRRNLAKEGSSVTQR